MVRPDLAAYVLRAMIAWIPVSSHAATEASMTTLSRYAAIANDIADTVVEADDRIIPYRSWSLVDGKFEALPATDAQRVKTAFLMASIARYESNFVAAVDSCARPGDGGRAWGLWQVHAPKEQACASRRAGLRIALAMATKSFRACGHLPEGDRLSVYATGSCFERQAESRARVGLGASWLTGHPAALIPASDVVPTP